MGRRRNACALSCGVGRIGLAEASRFGHLQAQHVSRRYNRHKGILVEPLVEELAGSCQP